jgi:hypothetical protein
VFPSKENSTLTFRLQVTDWSGASDTDVVTVTGAIDTNRPPTADAGADIIVNPGESVMLDGRGSTDPDGDPLTYSWTLVKSEPDRVSLNIANATSSTPSFVFPSKENSTLTFRLQVTDSKGASDTDVVTVVPSSPDFAITVTPNESVISQGDSAEFEVKVVQTNGKTMPISINVIVPDDIRGKLSVDYDGSATLPPFSRVVKIRPIDSLNEQQYSLVITAGNGNIEKLTERSVEYPLIVKAKEGGGWNAGMVGAVVGIPVAGLVLLSHFILPKPVGQPSTLVAKGHTFGLQIEAQLDDTGSSMPGAGGLGSISSFSEGGASDTIKNSFNQVLMQDTGETFEQFKQLKVIKGWLKKRMGRDQEAASQYEATPPDPNVAGNIGMELKKIIAENLGKVSTPELVRLVKQAVISEAVTRLEKGIESAAIPVPPVKASILFIPVIDGIPVRTNMLRLPFEINPVVELKGAKTIVKEDVKSFFADFVDLRMKLYYLMPMMLGTKRVKFTDKTVQVAKDVTVKVTKDSAS